MWPAEVTSATLFLVLLTSVDGQRKGNHRFINNYDRNPYLMTEREIEEASKFPTPEDPGHHEFKVTQMGDVTEVKFGPQKPGRGRGSGRRPQSEVPDQPGSRTRSRQKNKSHYESTTSEKPNYPENFPIKPNNPEKKGNYNKKPVFHEKPNYPEASNHQAIPVKSAIPAHFPEFISSSPRPFVKKRPVKVMVKKIPMSSGRHPLPIKYMDNSDPPKPEKSPNLEVMELPKKFKPPETFLQMRNKVNRQPAQSNSSSPDQDENRPTRHRKRKKTQEPKLPPLIRKPEVTDGNPEPPQKTVPTKFVKQPSLNDEVIEIAPLSDDVFEKTKKNTFGLTEVEPMKTDDNLNRDKPNFSSSLFHKGPRKIKTTSIPMESDEPPNYPEHVFEEDFGSRNPASVLTTEEKVVLNHVMHRKPTSPPVNYKRQRQEPKPRKKPAKLMEEAEAVPTNLPTQPSLPVEQFHSEVTTKRPKKRPTKSTVAPAAPTGPSVTFTWDGSQSSFGKPFDWNDYEAARDAWRSGPALPHYPVHPTLPSAYPTLPSYVYPTVPSHVYPTTPAPTYSSTVSSNFDFDFTGGVERQPGFVSYHVQTPRYQSHDTAHYHHEVPKPPPPPHQWNLVSHDQSFRGHYATSHQSIVLGHSGKSQKTIHDFVIHHRY